MYAGLIDPCKGQFIETCEWRTEFDGILHEIGAFLIVAVQEEFSIIAIDFAGELRCSVVVLFFAYVETIHVVRLVELEIDEVVNNFIGRLTGMMCCIGRVLLFEAEVEAETPVVLERLEILRECTIPVDLERERIRIVLS